MSAKEQELKAVQSVLVELQQDLLANRTVLTEAEQQTFSACSSKAVWGGVVGGTVGAVAASALVFVTRGVGGVGALVSRMKFPLSVGSSMLCGTMGANFRARDCLVSVLALPPNDSPRASAARQRLQERAPQSDLMRAVEARMSGAGLSADDAGLGAADGGGGFDNPGDSDGPTGLAQQLQAQTQGQGQAAHPRRSMAEAVASLGAREPGMEQGGAVAPLEPLEPLAPLGGSWAGGEEEGAWGAAADGGAHDSAPGGLWGAAADGGGNGGSNGREAPPRLAPAPRSWDEVRRGVPAGFVPVGGDEGHEGSGSAEQPREAPRAVTWAELRERNRRGSG